MAHGGYGVLPTSKRGAEDKRGGAIEHHDNAHSSGARMSYKRIFYLDPHRTFSSAASWPDPSSLRHRPLVNGGCYQSVSLSLNPSGKLPATVCPRPSDSPLALGRRLCFYSIRIDANQIIVRVWLRFSPICCCAVRPKNKIGARAIKKILLYGTLEHHKLQSGKGCTQKIIMDKKYMSTQHIFSKKSIKLNLLPAACVNGYLWGKEHISHRIVFTLNFPLYTCDYTSGWCLRKAYNTWRGSWDCITTVSVLHEPRKFVSPC